MDNPLSSIQDDLQAKAGDVTDQVTSAADGVTDQVSNAADSLGNLDQVIGDGIDQAQEKLDGFVSGLDNFLSKF